MWVRLTHWVPKSLKIYSTSMQLTGELSGIVEPLARDGIPYLIKKNRCGQRAVFVLQDGVSKEQIPR